MKREEFEAVARRAEMAAAANPGAYRMRVGLLAALGYGFVWFLLLGALGLVGIGIAALVLLDFRGATLRLLELAVPAVIFVGIVLKALWIEIPPPEGVSLSRAELPDLFETLEQIRRKLKGPRIHTVLVNEEFNAAISQVPRLGIFGWHRNYLLLGLPLLLTLSKQQAIAVLAHEYGHLSGSHGKFGAWIYRIRRTWYQLMTALDQKGGAGGALLSTFFDWYAPYFDAYSFALARAQEYEADRASATVVGATHAGAALVRTETAARVLDSEFWPAVYRHAADSPDPTERPYALMAAGANLDIPHDKARTWLQEALRAKTTMSNTHPSLADRLRGLALTPVPATTPAQNAAHAFLGERLDGLVSAFDDRWQTLCAAAWRERFDNVAHARNRLGELAAVSEGERSVDHILEQAHLTHEVHGREEALAFYRAVVQRDPQNPAATFQLALAALARGEDEGVTKLEALMTREPSLELDGAVVLRDYFASKGEMEKANGFHDRAVQLSEANDRIRAERSSIPLAEVYDPPDLADEERAQLVALLRADSFVKHAWVVRRRLRLSQDPVYIVGVVGSTRLTAKDDRGDVAQRLAVALTLPFEIYVLVLEGNNRGLLSIFKKVDGSQLL